MRYTAQHEALQKREGDQVTSAVTTEIEPSKHREQTEVLAAWLDEHGLDVWWDADLESRDPFDWQLDEKLRTATCVVVIWTEGAVGSDWVLKEVAIARDRGILVATKVDDLPSDRIPEAFRRHDAHKFNAERGKILRDVLAIREGRLLLDDKQEPLPMDPTPTMLLQAKFGLVPFTGSNAVRDGLVSWAMASGRRDAGRLIHGSGGLGKTRLLIEVADALRRKGWSAGFLVRPGSGDLPGDTSETITRRRERRAKALLHLIRSANDKGLLLVMDYTEGRDAEIAQIAAAIRARPAEDQRPIRLVLLTRGAGDWWTRFAEDNQIVRALFGGEQLDLHAIGGINSGQERLDLFNAAVMGFAHHLSAMGYALPVEAEGPPESWAATRVLANRLRILEANSGYELGEGYDRPLAITMEALLYLAAMAPATYVPGVHNPT